MNNLQRLMNLQKGKTGDEQSTHSTTVRGEDSPKGEAGPGDDSPSPEQIPPKYVPAPEAPKKVASLGGLKLAGTKPKPPKPDAEKRPEDSGSTGSGGLRSDRTADSRDDGPVEFTLDDIAGLDESVAPAKEPKLSPSEFLDEISATAPDRELPKDLEPQQLEFVENLDSIYAVLNDAEMFGQAVRLIMMELQENPEYVRLVADQDVHTMILAMRNTMGLAKIKKQAKKRGSGGAKKAGKALAGLDDALALMDSMGILGDD